MRLRAQDFQQVSERRAAWTGHREDGLQLRVRLDDASRAEARLLDVGPDLKFFNLEQSEMTPDETEGSSSQTQHTELLKIDRGQHSSGEVGGLRDLKTCPRQSTVAAVQLDSSLQSDSLPTRAHF